MSSPTLKASLSLPLVILYGMGTILGAGIYVLIGEVAGVAGFGTPLSFLLAALLAALSAFSYAELSSRFPRSAGEAVYVVEGLGWQWLAIFVGFLVILVGVTSAATIVRGFVGYLWVFIYVPLPLALAVLVSGLGFIAWWGVLESVLIAGLLSLFEAFGLLMVIWVSRNSLAGLPAVWPEIVASTHGGWLAAIIPGAFLAFYAFIGFEDMVNVAEEVKNPRRTLPLAIVLVLVLTSILYFAVSLAAVLAVAPAEPAGQKAPLSHLYAVCTGRRPVAITIIGMFAVVNGALIQIIMASRILYGMSVQGWFPKVIGRIHSRTRTPHIATLIIAIGIMIFALWLPLVVLAEATSFITLVIFSLINLSFIRVKFREPRPAGVVVYPLWLPWRD
ncbi:MAG TPA: amino acid permease [Proteobacteria bacterium]|nr:amino acid permease [Pseudomonadota bacterium]